MILPVIASGDEERCRQATAGLETLPPVVGGATRQASVRAGLEALSARAPEIVLVHDAARPFASAALVSSAIAAGRKHGAAVPALPVTDTIKTVDPRGNVAATLERAALRTIQTPQAFEFTRLLAAHRKAAAAGQENFSDDAALIEWAGSQVATFAGETGNIKLTTTEDFVRAEAELIGRLGDVRVGTGYDVHAFGEGDHIMLGGVRIAHARGLVGHSDADVVLHALVDAILGAIADGDIGVHFPPGDAAWRNASSDRFLAFAVGRVRARGGMIAHLDAAVVCEAPRIAPHRDAMRARIAEIAGVTPDRVALQATTSEKLGFAGRGEGIAAMATATVRLPLRSGDEGTS
jgi:2-C-methyl-D-erythritol 4-phosphate cytidylyltransferase/2-C-methyl-D-erythritol 2,4-cyclodiphosphate synthase